jgi:hypothetical protein
MHDSQTLLAVLACRFGGGACCQIFADSKFLREEALLDLVRAVIWAASGFQRAASSGEDTDAEQVLPVNHALQRPRPESLQTLG